ncbi:MAG: hypothetical protein R2865_13295 [Deinococcales bacterium]
MEERKKYGLAPGSIVYTGEGSGSVSLDLIHYEQHDSFLRSPAKDLRTF